MNPNVTRTRLLVLIDNEIKEKQKILKTLPKHPPQHYTIQFTESFSSSPFEQNSISNESTNGTIKPRSKLSTKSLPKSRAYLNEICLSFKNNKGASTCRKSKTKSGYLPNFVNYLRRCKRGSKVIEKNKIITPVKKKTSYTSDYYVISI